jgi:hypothetical protein
MKRQSLTNRHAMPRACSDQLLGPFMLWFRSLSHCVEVDQRSSTKPNIIDISLGRCDLGFDISFSVPEPFSAAAYIVSKSLRDCLQSVTYFR